MLKFYEARISEWNLRVNTRYYSIHKVLKIPGSTATIKYLALPGTIKSIKYGPIPGTTAFIKYLAGPRYYSIHKASGSSQVLWHLNIPVTISYLGNLGISCNTGSIKKEPIPGTRARPNPSTIIYKVHDNTRYYSISKVPGSSRYYSIHKVTSTIIYPL